MLIDISNYVTVIIDKLNVGGFYSELDIEDLEKSITKQLNLIYDEKIAALSLKLDIERYKGNVIENDSYKKEYDKIRREIMTEAYDIALCKKPEIPAIPES